MEKIAEYGLVAGIAAIVSPICSVAAAAIKGWAQNQKAQSAPPVNDSVSDAIIAIARQTEMQTELLRQCVRGHEAAREALARIEVKLDGRVVNGHSRLPV